MNKYILLPSNAVSRVSQVCFPDFRGTDDPSDIKVLKAPANLASKVLI